MSDDCWSCGKPTRPDYVIPAPTSVDRWFTCHICEVSWYDNLKLTPASDSRPLTEVIISCLPAA